MRQPLPRFSDYSISHDFVNRMIAEILRRKSRVIVESVNGLSTIIGGYCLRRLRRGRLISLEYEEEYFRPFQALFASPAVLIVDGPPADV